MRRYWIDRQYHASGHFKIEGDLFHHIFDVCRQELGSRFELLCDGKAYLVEVTDLHKKAATAQIRETRELPKARTPKLHLVLSIPKFSTLETILEKSVELGVSEVHLCFSDYSFVRTPEKFTTERMARFRKIILGATQQTGRGDLLTLHSPQSLDQLLTSHPELEKVGIFAYEGEGEIGLRERLEQIPTPENLWLFVGSEGGFSQKEVSTLKEKGLKPTTLGQQVLRVETACLALLSVLKYHFQLWE